jgi:hypothetical protein
MYAPKTTHELSDEIIVGKVYDNRVVRRLLTYIGPYKKDALLSLTAVLVYTAAQVGLPLVIMWWINWGINSGVGWRLHMMGLIFFAVTLLHFGANYLQSVAIARVPECAVQPAYPALQPPAEPVSGFLSPHLGWTHHVAQPERCPAAARDV